MPCEVVLAPLGRPESSGQHGLTVLSVVVTDDSEMFRRALGAILAESGLFQVVGQAGTGAEAIDLVDRASPDLVVMDVAMPVMNGAAATRWIATHRPGVAVVLISSLLPGQMPDEVWDCGAIGCVAKDELSPALLERLYRQHAADRGPRG